MKRDRRARRDDEELKKIAGARKGYSAGNAGREEPLHYGHEGLTLRDSGLGLTVRAGLFNFVFSFYRESESESEAWRRASLVSIRITPHAPP